VLKLTYSNVGFEKSVREIEGEGEEWKRTGRD